MESDKRGKKKIRTERYKGEKMGKEESKREGGGVREREREWCSWFLMKLKGVTGCCKNGF